MRKLFIFLLLGIFLMNFGSSALLVALGNSTTESGQNALGVSTTFSNSAFNFTTPAGSSPYLVTTVVGTTAYHIGAPNGAMVMFYHQNSSFMANGTIVQGKVSTPINLAAGANNFTLLGGGVTLQPSTTYWILFNISTLSASDYIRWGETTGTGNSIWGSGTSPTTMIYNKGAGAGNQVQTINVKLYGTVVSSATATLNSPANNTAVAGNSNVVLNWTSTASDALVNTTLVINGVTNETITISGTTNTTTTTKRFAVGNYLWNVTSCSATSCGSSSTYNLSVGEVGYNSQTFTNPVGEGVSNTFTGNFTTNGTAVSSIFLNYSGTLYAATLSSDNNTYVGTKAITSPLVTGTVNYTFNWIVTLADGYVFNSTLTNQTVSDFLIGNCTTYNNTIYNFTIVDETSQIKLNTSALDTVGEVDFDLYLADGTSLLASYAYNFTDINPFGLCSSSALTVSDSFILDGQIQYTGTGYVKEFYNIQRENLTVADKNTNITLYALNSTIAQEFLVTYTDENFNPVEDALVYVTRKYISEGVFKTVELPLTDNNGQALVNLVLSDVIYTFNVYKDNVLLGTFENVVAFCDNIATGDCKINLNSYASTTIPDTFANIDDYTFLISFNDTTRVVTSSFTIASGSSATNILNVTLFDGYGTTEVCSHTLVTSSGTLTCTVPQAYENSTITIKLFKDSTLMAQAIISQDSTPEEIYGASRVFVALMAFLLIIGIGISDSPAIMGVLLIIGAIILVSFNMITSAGIIGATATVLWFIVAVVLVIIKGVKR